MLDSLFLRKTEKRFPTALYTLSFDLFALAQFWDSPVDGAARGRLFEKIAYRYCEKRQLPLAETAGSRTVRGVRAASGFMHENDAVLAFPEFTVHFELKHLRSDVSKNDLLIFNQKGIDYLLAEDRRLRQLPFFRILLSGGLVNPAARRFALQWGILVIEPDRLPLVLIHQLAGYAINNLRYVSLETQETIWDDIPRLVVPLQDRLRRCASVLEGEETLLGQHRSDWAIDHIQREVGDYYWNALDESDPSWLEGRFDILQFELGLDRLA